jgi:hypothetical protein
MIAMLPYTLVNQIHLHPDEGVQHLVEAIQNEK